MVFGVARSLWLLFASLLPGPIHCAYVHLSLDLGA